MRLFIRSSAIAAVLAAAACTIGPADGTTPGVTAGATTVPSSVPSTPAPSTPPTAEAAADRCRPPVKSAEGMVEVRGTSPDAELWALPFAALPFKPGKEVKIVWRMTGSGPLEVGAALPDGTRATLAWGPEGHSGSTWKRPGEEWGTGFVFPKAGCWRVHLTRTTGQGDVWFSVV
jgi:hypothetical protein